MTAASSASTPQRAHTLGPAGFDHFRAAVVLHSENLLGPADHLAGLAAECAIKAILIDCLGYRYHPKKKPFRPNGGALAGNGHLPTLWDELVHAGSQRSITQTLMPLLALSGNPFHEWEVDHRYRDGRDGMLITPARVTRHLSTARQLCAAYQQLPKTGSAAAP